MEGETDRPSQPRPGSSDPICRPPLYAGDRARFGLNGQRVRSQPLPQGEAAGPSSMNQAVAPNEVRSRRRGCFWIDRHPSRGDVRFTPESDLIADISVCPLSAISRHRLRGSQGLHSKVPCDVYPRFARRLVARPPGTNFYEISFMDKFQSRSAFSRSSAYPAYPPVKSLGRFVTCCASLQSSK
jgi:hypothetical protein